MLSIKFNHNSWVVLYQVIVFGFDWGHPDRLRVKMPMIVYVRCWVRSRSDWWLRSHSCRLLFESRPPCSQLQYGCQRLHEGHWRPNGATRTTTKVTMAHWLLHIPSHSKLCRHTASLSSRWTSNRCSRKTCCPGYSQISPYRREGAHLHRTLNTGDQ